MDEGFRCQVMAREAAGVGLGSGHAQEARGSHLQLHFLKQTTQHPTKSRQRLINSRQHLTSARIY